MNRQLFDIHVRGVCLVLACALAVGPLVWAQESRERPVPREVLPAGLEQAIDRGLAFLQKQQWPDGSFDASGPANAMAGLAILAFLASGHTPDLGRYGLVVRNAVDYLLKQKNDDGYFGRDGGRMYSHCIVTIALAEVYGTEIDPAQRKKVRETLERALKVILDAQDVQKDKEAAGGWRYEPKSPDSDLSVSAWCMVGLRACQDAGLNVPEERVKRALGYLRRCYRPQQKGFGYTPGEQATPSMTGAALLCMYLLDAANTAEGDGAAAAGVAARYLADKPVEDARYYYYAMYYTTQAAFQAGERAWAVVWKHTQSRLLSAQRRDDGSWPPRNNEPGGEGRAGRFYSTAMSCLTLSVPLRLLPIYQR